MSQSFAVGGTVARRQAGEQQVASPDARRNLQLTLGVIWVLDGILQYQPFMFSKAFPQMLAGTSSGNPGVVAHPINWSSNFIDHHLVAVNTAFATIQLALGLGIAFRPTVKIALGASVAWALGVWWFGEGLGGVLTGNASPLNGAPGAVILYALLAVLLWPADRDPAAPFVAGRAVGRRVAQGLWLVLWAGLALFALMPASRAPKTISGFFSAMASGQPGWLAWIDSHAATLVGSHSLLVSIVLAVALGAVALGTFLPPPAARATIVLAIGLAAVIWLAEGMGGIFTGGGTDPNSGPLLAFLAVAFWPAAASRPASTEGA
jgi:hypothetical protein